MSKEIFHVVKIQGCNCGTPGCPGTEMLFESNSGWTESIIDAKEYSNYPDAAQAAEDYCTFYQDSKLKLWFHIDKMYRP